MNPRFRPMVAACVRSLAPSLERILVTSFDCVFGEIELRGDLFIGVAGRDQPQDFDLTLRQNVLAGMFRQL